MTGYAQDIRPKFRANDIACMARKNVKLDEPQWMCDPAGGRGFDDHANARRVFAALSAGFMPPDGAWPPDWVDAYRDWMNQGFEP